MSCKSCGQGDSCLCGSFSEVSDLNCGTLVGDLSPLADCIRDLFTQLGARQYQVNLVWMRWTGGKRGIGNAFVLKTEPLLPTPLVSPLTGINLTLQAIGSSEEGGLQISELSPRYTEDFLMGRDEDSNAIPADVTFFWEVVFYQNGSPGPRRRFTPSSSPAKDSTGFQWSISLKRQADDRSPKGLAR